MPRGAHTGNGIRPFFSEADLEAIRVTDVLVDVDPEHLAQQVAGALSAAGGIEGGASVAHADIEVAVGVIVEGLGDGQQDPAYRGMGSLSAMARGSADRYFQDSGTGASSGSLAKLVPEGIEGMVPHKGSLHQMLPQLTGGLRSGMGLAGCASIDELRTKAKLVRISPAGLKEGHAHGVVITKESPNYWVER